MDLVLPTVMAALGALWCVIGLVRAIWLGLRRSARRCPGPRLSWRQRLHPLTLVYRRRCGYDLGGHIDLRSRAGAVGRMPQPVTCPECGRCVHSRRELLRGAWNLRPLGMAAVAFLVALALHRHPPFDGAALVALASTDVLLRGESSFGTGTPIEIRDELRRRAMDHEMSEGEIRRFVALLVHDLRDDGLVGNAKDAMRKLAIFGTFDPQPLLDALTAPDRQQRRLAAEVVRELPGIGLGVEHPPAALIAASIEDLRDDEISWNSQAAWDYLASHRQAAIPGLKVAIDSDDAQQRRNAMEILRSFGDDPAIGPDVRRKLLVASIGDLASNASSGDAWVAFRYLRANAGRARDLLADAMVKGDGRTRLLAAATAGCAGAEDLVDHAAPILIRHLADNAIRGDAVVAARALWGFGAAALPHLESALARAVGDEQLQQSLRYLIARMTTARSIASLQRELPLARLTTASQDAISLDPDELDVPWAFGGE